MDHAWPQWSARKALSPRAAKIHSKRAHAEQHRDRDRSPATARAAPPETPPLPRTPIRNESDDNDDDNDDAFAVVAVAVAANAHAVTPSNTSDRVKHNSGMAAGGLGVWDFINDKLGGGRLSMIVFRWCGSATAMRQRYGAHRLLPRRLAPQHVVSGCLDGGSVAGAAGPRALTSASELQAHPPRGSASRSCIEQHSHYTVPHATHRRQRCGARAALPRQRQRAKTDHRDRSGQLTAGGTWRRCQAPRRSPAARTAATTASTRAGSRTGRR